MPKIRTSISGDASNPKHTTKTAFVNGIRYEVKCDEEVSIPVIVNEVFRDSINANKKYTARPKNGQIVDRGDSVREF